MIRALLSHVLLIHVLLIHVLWGSARMEAARTRLWPAGALRRHARGLQPLSDARLGLAGERLAALELRRAGCWIAARRLMTGDGELDLVLRDSGELVVVEVKTGRVGARFRPGDRLDPVRVMRLAEAARRLAERLDVNRWRVELFEVGLTNAGGLELDRREIRRS